ncbi:MAG: hypothetical protein N3G21_03920 [Candidatus Hydrogenedentes bacterium]|nr:hypothetical protein [Candidatus Hydrogenedentota bacterium]
MINLTAWIYSVLNPCSKYESLIVTDAYEDLTEKEKEELVAHISVCTKCRKNYEEVSSFVNKISKVREIVWDDSLLEDIDLLPEVLTSISGQEVDEKEKSSVGWRIPITVGLSLACLVLVFWGYMEYGSESRNGVSVSNLGSFQNIDSKMMAQTDLPLQKQKEKLRRIIENYKGEDFAGEALLMLADIEFSSEEKYEEAHRSYKSLRVNYPHIFSSSPQAIYRFNLLEEVSGENYKPLYVLNSSSGNIRDSVQQLEGIVKRYPGTLVAQLAVQKMLECYADGKSLTPDKQIALLESIRYSISDPTVLAQVDYILGDLYWKQKSDLRSAEKFFESVYYSGPPSLKPMAHDALVQLVSYSE